jgi:hypothetical protein
MFNKFLHKATKNLRNSSSEIDSSKRVETIKEIFEIETSKKNRKKRE